LIVTAFVPASSGSAAGSASAVRRHADWQLLLSATVLYVIGALSVYAATRNSLEAGGRPGTAYLKRDLINLAVLLKPYQEQRFTAFTSDHPASTSTGYQIQQSLIAIGSGGLTGQGFLAGSQTDGGFVPEQQTDFVFTVAAE
jgi:rod shape determining protein RodA